MNRQRRGKPLKEAGEPTLDALRARSRVVSKTHILQGLPGINTREGQRRKTDMNR